MTKEELDFLFRKHLKREPTNKDWIVHNKKTVSNLEAEILVCDEYIKLVMTKEELEFLFRKYLKREPTNDDWFSHNKKTVSSLEAEILVCDEYIKLINDNNKNTISDLKIAILISGHIRKNSILDGINKFCNTNNYDVFIHTWDNIGIKGNETSLNDPSVTTSVDLELAKFHNLKKYEIENNKEYIELQDSKQNYFNFSSPEVFIKSQLYSINKCYKLMEEYGEDNNIKYDIVFRFRFDSDLTNFNLTKNLINDILSYKIIFVPNIDNQHTHPDYGTSCWACDNLYYKYGRKHVHIFEHTNVICDLFAYGSQESMKKYCDLYNNYDELNDSFFNDNLKQYQTITDNIKYENGNYNLKGHNGHIDSLYYYNCSYPERLLQKFLKDFMLVQSKEIKLNLVR